VTEAPKPGSESPAEPPVRDSGPVEGVWGNREVPPANSAQSESDEPTLEQRLAQADARAEEHLDDLRRLAAEFDNC
jgi:molecular chaperone GrpE (heat shock protein)